MDKRLLEELKRRTASVSFDLEKFCFPEQLAFIQDPSKFKTAVCSRRSGKTVACAADLINTVLSHEEGDVAYITLNRRTAKKIIWRQLLDINRLYNLDAKPDATELTLTFPHGPVIHVSGAKDESEIAKFLGHPLRKAYIDEAQSFRPYIKELVEDVLEPTLIDYDGSLILIGTPGPVPAGYFYDSSHAKEGWSHHKWTMFNNPHILRKSKKTPQEHVNTVCQRRGLDHMHPSIQREFYGQWTYDADSLVFSFNKHKNLYLPPIAEKLEYIFGIDIGYNDADAIAVLGFSYESNNVYLVDEYVATKQDITSLSNKIKEMRATYNPIKMIMDAGALGKKIQAEIQQRHEIPLEAAEKSRKFEYLELFNDDLRNARFKSFPNSRFEQDSYLVQWDRAKVGKLKISDIYHTDIGDAILYGWRECRHYLYRHEEVIKVDHNSDEFMLALEEMEAEKMERQMKSSNDNVSQEDLEYIYDPNE